MFNCLARLMSMGVVGGHHVLVCDGSGPDLLVVPFRDRAYHDVQTGARLCHRLEHLRILVVVGCSPDDERNINRFSHFLGDFCCMLGREILAVGICTCQPKAYDVRLVRRRRTSWPMPPDLPSTSLNGSHASAAHSSGSMSKT